MKKVFIFVFMCFMFLINGSEVKLFNKKDIAQESEIIVSYFLSGDFYFENKKKHKLESIYKEEYITRCKNKQVVCEYRIFFSDRTEKTILFKSLKNYLVLWEKILSLNAFDLNNISVDAALEANSMEKYLMVYKKLISWSRVDKYEISLKVKINVKSIKVEAPFQLKDERYIKIINAIYRYFFNKDIQDPNKNEL